MRESDRVLADALRAAGLEELVERAAAGEWNDYFGKHGAPQHALIGELRGYTGSRRYRANILINRIIDGDFDGTPAEAEEYMTTPEADEVMRLVREHAPTADAVRGMFDQIGVDPPDWLAS